MLRDRRWFARLCAAVGLGAAIAIVGVLASTAGGPSPVSAATTIVKVGAIIPPSLPRDRYVRPSITIQQGDTVEWQIADGYHDVKEFSGGFWSPRLVSSGTRTFSWTFNSPGLVGYYCTLHATVLDLDTNGDGAFTEADAPDFTNNMVGTVNVVAPATETPT